MEIKVVKETDELTDNGLSINLSHRLGRFRKWFISNIFDRSLSYLVGWTGSNAKMLLCTEAGILKTSGEGSIFDVNETLTGTSTNAFVSLTPFTSICSLIDVWVSSNNVTIQRSRDGVIYDDAIPLLKDVFYSFDCSTKDVMIKSTAAGVHGTVQVVGWR